MMGCPSRSHLIFGFGDPEEDMRSLRVSPGMSVIGAALRCDGKSKVGLTGMMKKQTSI